MFPTTARSQAKVTATSRPEKKANIPLNPQGTPIKVGQYFGENVFHVGLSKSIPESAKKELQNVVSQGKHLSKELAEIVANAVTEWALSKGVTHFCHWFQPLTGITAEKHDSFLTLDGERPIEKLSASQLMQGEPDASSFPHGGVRSTFEARGYTSWDITSPIFIMEGVNGKTLCIPTAFVSYHGDALDIKTPLLRSNSRLGELTTKFLNLIAQSPEEKVGHVEVTCGPEQEYFLVDKDFYYLRPDLVMTGRTLIGSLTAKNQQLEDHYFGTIKTRILSFMQDLEVELYKMGVPAKTRHNEVAPAQYELACIYRSANVAADQNQLTMATLQKVAHRHNFMALLHEKPFAGVNGSGKHVNWSLASDKGKNLFNPGENPNSNYRFMAMVSIVLEAIDRHAEILRAGIASHGNDHRLGANEAPPSIISVFLGDALTKILEDIGSGKNYAPNQKTFLDIGARQLAQLLKDNTDRNRTSPFAFTGDKFEFRAVGSSAAVGFPLAILNAAVADVMNESCTFIEAELKSGKTAEDALASLIKKWFTKASRIIFNGDGYSEDWVKEAAKRGLPNHRTTPEALKVFKDPSKVEFLSSLGIFRQSEIMTRYNVLVHRFNVHREIEFECLNSLVRQQVLPAGISYKQQLLQSYQMSKDTSRSAYTVEDKLLKKLDEALSAVYDQYEKFSSLLEKKKNLKDEECALSIAKELMPEAEILAQSCNKLEEMVPDELWTLPKYYDMLFLS